MPDSRALIALVLCGAAARTAEIQPIIDRPPTLPQGKVDLTLHGTYTNWGNGSAAGAGPASLEGETLALGVDFGATDQFQLGFVVALPIHPGAGFGSILGGAGVALGKESALRIDVGYERVGFNGDTGTLGLTHIDRFFSGIGGHIKVPITPTIAFVSGRTGVVHFGHFDNIGDSGTGFYLGSSLLTEAASDFFVVSGGSNDSSTNIGINLPLGLLLQPDPQLAITLQAGYSAVIQIPSSGSAQALHFVPIGLQAVVSATPALDIGASFFLDGYVGNSGGSSGNPGYFDLRALMLWFRVRV